MEKTKVLITGGAGYIGSVLTELLLRSGYEVTVFDDLRYKQTSLLHLFSHPDFKFVKGDVRQGGWSTLQRLSFEHDITIPLAAVVGMPACEANPRDATEINFEQIKVLTEWIGIMDGKKLIVPNTNSQYGSSDTIITEESPFNPLSHYAQTKCDAEEYMLEHDAGVSFRLATVFGVSPRMRMDLLVNDFVYRSVTDRFLVLFESHFKRNYIHVRDVARAFLFVINNYDSCVGEAFNVGLSSANLSKYELAERIKIWLPDLTIIQNEFKKDLDQRNYIVSNEKLEGLGWIPHYTLDYGILELIDACEMIEPKQNAEFTNL